MGKGEFRKQDSKGKEPQLTKKEKLAKKRAKRAA